MPQRVQPFGLPLLHRPSGVVFVDDDSWFLEALARAIPDRWRCQFFTHPLQALSFLKSEAPFVQADLWQHQCMIRSWMEGTPLAPQLLHYWATQTERFALTQVLVVDAQLPAMSGLDLLDRLDNFEGRKVLLTGTVNGQAALKAFNGGQIDYYLPKHHPDLLQEVKRCLGSLAECPTDRSDATWALCLRDDQQELILREGPALQALLTERFVEYAIIGDPFGVLGLAPGGRLEWVQLVPFRGDLPGKVSNRVLMSQLKSVSEATEVEVERLSTGLGLGFFDLSALTLKLPPISHFEHWLASQAPRQIDAADRSPGGGKC